ncbi:MAG: T9SS type A sorting domain-containing protein, partial [Ignavibacteria bacterium]|nr:T9SS type A sorting domain-containing protein [Ignavibacteria bacterium]
DYVAHEMGHQFGGNHKYNGTGCGGGRVASAAYEPGSASTIQGYAGICGSDNLQPNSDAYFHYISIQEIRTRMTSTSCAQTSPTGNSDPSVNVPSGGQYIPKQTPFLLTGSASDPNNDPLFYCWEEWDLGPACPWNNPTGTAPTFRSWTATSSPTRIFPRLQNLLNNTTAVGEFFPAYSRILTFRLTVRDNRAGGGGVGTALMTPINIDANSGPFLVTFPNTPVTIGGGQHIQWNVAGTNVAPVNCANVNILLSTDGGYNWPITLKSNTPNDGIEFVNLPAINNNQARIKVEAVGNIFFDISNTNFTIDLSVGITQHSTPVEFTLSQNFPNPFNPVTTIRYGIPKMSNVTLKVYDITGRLVTTLIDNELKTEGYYNIELDATHIPSGLYIYTLEAGEFRQSRKMIIVK